MIIWNREENGIGHAPIATLYFRRKKESAEK